MHYCCFSGFHSVVATVRSSGQTCLTPTAWHCFKTIFTGWTETYVSCCRYRRSGEMRHQWTPWCCALVWACCPMWPCLTRRYSQVTVSRHCIATVKTEHVSLLRPMFQLLFVHAELRSCAVCRDLTLLETGCS